MNKRFTAILMFAVLGMLAGGTWVSCGGSMEKCPYCGESFPLTNVRFHVRKCPKNTTNHKLRPASGKTTTVD